MESIMRHPFQKTINKKEIIIMEMKISIKPIITDVKLKLFYFSTTSKKWCTPAHDFQSFDKNLFNLSAFH